MTYNFCQKCFTRFEACETCHAAELAAKDKEIALRDAVIAAQIREIERLNSEIKSLQGSLRDSLADKDVDLIMTKLHRYESHIYSSLLGESRVLFEAIDTGDWVKASEHLKMVEKMKCCETCKHYNDFKNRKGSACYSCGDDVSYHNWEIRK